MMINSIDDPTVLALDSKRGQPARSVGARIYTDSVDPLIYPIRDGVAVDDVLSVMTAMFEEGLPYPAQVAGGLLLQR